MTKRVWMVMMVVLMMAASVQASQVGEQTTHTAGGVAFRMRLGPSVNLVDDGGNVVERVNAYWIAETEVTYELWYTTVVDVAKGELECGFWGCSLLHRVHGL